MPSPSPSSKPTLSMIRPKADPAAADAFVRAASVEKLPAAAPEIVAPPKEDAALADAPHDEAVAVAPSPKKTKKRQAAKAAIGAKSPRGVLTRSNGRQVRRRVVYLPPLLDKKLAVAAAERGVDVSEVVADLVLSL